MERKIKDGPGEIHIVKYDEEDEDLILNASIYYNRSQDYHYVANRINGKNATTARLILARKDPEFDIKESKQFVDHINGDPMDNRRENLRKSNAKNNAKNHKKFSNNTTGHNGIQIEKAKTTYSYCAVIGAPRGDEHYEKKRFKNLHAAITWRYNRIREVWDEELLRDQRPLQEILDSVEDHTFEDGRQTTQKCPHCDIDIPIPNYEKHKDNCYRQCACGKEYHSSYKGKGSHVRTATAKLKRHRLTCNA